MKLSKDFTLEELTYSLKAKQVGITNKPTPEAASNLNLLAKKLLQPLRDAWGKPMMVNSGYRCPALNKAVGGVSTSQHAQGQAADIAATNPAELVRCLMDSNLDFDQCIKYPTFVHLSYRGDGRNRRQFLTHK